MSKRILLAGATGLIGRQVALGLAADSTIAGPVVVPVRRDPGFSDAKIVAVVADLADSDADAALESRIRAVSGGGIDTYVCCLGTTMKVAGSPTAFLAVDRELVLRLARIAKKLGAKHAILVSSVGASEASRNFYLRVKGEVEQRLFDLVFQRIDIVRPGLLLGARNEKRLGEHIGQLAAPLYNPLLGGRLRKYRAIESSTVARAIVAMARQRDLGRFVHEFDSLSVLGRA
ncbi:MAG: hypothetical protein NDJ92_02300 [Thermoanaerobaculia bacterium]|nr:hypothetical protein [Thermoanaerobaculia bacterium]